MEKFRLFLSKKVMGNCLTGFFDTDNNLLEFGLEVYGLNYKGGPVTLVAKFGGSKVAKSVCNPWGRELEAA